jgi:hypothetical protein
MGSVEDIGCRSGLVRNLVGIDLTGVRKEAMAMLAGLVVENMG